MTDLENTQGKTFSAGLFDTFRSPPYPTLYGPKKTPVTADVLEAGLLYAFGTLLLCFLLILPGVIFRKRLLFFMKFSVGLFILISIFLCNFGQEWEVAEVHAVTQYKAFTKKEISAEITVKIGLRSVNITLKSHPENGYIVNFGKYNETINYNERFSWDNPGWTQGRGGFGPYAGLINQEFRAAQYKGLPYPILWIAEYFVPDGEGIRWGRFYRQAGYYSHIFMWLAFPLFILSIILIMMVRSYGALFFLLTGLSMLGGNFCFGLIRNPTQLKIPFEPHALEFHWGWCFWLCLITGFLNIILGSVAFVLDFVCPDWLCEFLNIDVTKDYEEFYLSLEELQNLGIKVNKDHSRGGTKADSNGIARAPTGSVHGYRKRMTGFEERLGTTRFGKNRTQSRYRIINLNNEGEDKSIEAAIQRRPERERPALPPKMFGSRKPVVPMDTDRSMGYNNPAADVNYDDIAKGEPGAVPRHLNLDPTKPVKGNYDNNTDAVVHHFRPEVSEDPIYDNSMVPKSPHLLAPTLEEEELEEDVFAPASNNNKNYGSPPVPPRVPLGNPDNEVNYINLEQKKEQKGANEDKKDASPEETKQDYIRLDSGGRGHRGRH